MLSAALCDKDSGVRERAFRWAVRLKNELRLTGPLVAQLEQMLPQEDSAIRLVVVEGLRDLAKDRGGLAVYPGAVKLLATVLQGKPDAPMIKQANLSPQEYLERRDEASLVKTAADTLHTFCPEWRPSRRL
jgi:hypothetical protein